MMDTAKRTGTPFTIHQNRRVDADYCEMRDVAEKRSSARCSRSNPG